MSPKQAQLRAFTLFEILIALVIFAILGVITAIGLHNALDANQRADKANQRLQQVEVAQALLRRDFRQIVDRSITDNDGSKIPAFVLGNNQVSFTCGGATNPFSTGNRSNLQRIDYTYSNGTLSRAIWPTLDRILTTKPTQMTLLNNVTNFKVRIYDNNNQLKNVWPLTTSGDLGANITQISKLPRAVQIDFTVKGQGTISDTILIPSRGIREQNGTTPPTKS
ncbi:MAG: type II secretion system protein GspJ [Coxiella sp. (in: Bacteria)]|nr:MAG: type II secretion system protein GspJ [Coxiella sp. (in: g-proteobacteria)]